MTRPGAGARLSLRALFPPPIAPGRHGDPGVVVPGGVLQRLWGDRLVLLGGPAAILLQVAHPLVAAGVSDHSDYRDRPGDRLLGTLAVTLAITFGDAAQAAAAARRVNRRHIGVRGSLASATAELPAGTTYDARDPELAWWVYATLLWTSARVHDRFGHRMTASERDAFVVESQPFASLFGVRPSLLDSTWRDFCDRVERVLPSLEVTAAARAIALDLMSGRLSPPVPGAGAAVRTLTGDLLPPALRDAYGLPDTGASRLATRAAHLGVRTLWPHAPLRLQQFPHLRVTRTRLGAA